MVPKRNIVILCLDSIRKDFFDKYATRIRSQADLSFDHCRAASSWSAPSHASMISGKLPSEHGIHTYNRHFQDLSKEETLFGDLDNAVALGASANVFAGPAFGFSRYFDEFTRATSTYRFEGLDPAEYFNNNVTDLSFYFSFLSDTIRSKHTVKSILNFCCGGVNVLSSASSLVPKAFDNGTKAVLRKSKNQIGANNEPFVAFCNVMEGHVPHQAVRGYDRKLYPDVSNSWRSDKYTIWELSENEFPKYWNKREQVYAAVVDYLDRLLLDYIEKVNRLTEHETVFIITADHGDNHARGSEHGMANHASSLSEGLIHVPFEIINPPPETVEVLNQRQNKLLSHLYLRELVTAMAKEDRPAVDGWNFVIPAEIVGRGASQDPSSRAEYWDRAQRCCVKDQQKILWDSQGRKVRYNLDQSKPSWQSNSTQIDTIPGWAKEQFTSDISEYKSQAKREGQSVPVTEATQERLANLGYAGTFNSKTDE